MLLVIVLSMMEHMLISLNKILFAISVIGIASAENGASGAASANETRSASSGGDHAHGTGAGAPGHVSAKGHQRRPSTGAGTEKGREEKETPSHVKEAESASGTENARGGAGAGTGGGTGSEGKVQREVKRALAV